MDINKKKIDYDNKYNICDLNSVRPKTNLKNITIKTNLKEKINIYPKNIKIELFYNKKKMIKIKDVSEGGFGKIILFGCKDCKKEKTVILKIPFEDVNEEPYILNNFLNNTEICNDSIIPISCIKDQFKNPFIIMQEANGNVTNLNLSGRLKTDLVLKILKFMICFFDKGYLFTDLKTDNILYSCKDEKNITFYLGDIGSFAKRDQKKDIIMTYPPPEYAYANKKQIADIQSLAYIIGATIGEIYGFGDYLSYSDGKKELTENELKKKLKKYHNMIKNSNIHIDIKNIIINLTDLEPKKRVYNLKKFLKNIK